MDRISKIHRPTPSPIPKSYASTEAMRRWAVTKPSKIAADDTKMQRTWDFSRSGSGWAYKPLTTAQKYEQLARRVRNEKRKKGILTNAKYLNSVRVELRLEDAGGLDMSEEMEGDEDDEDEEGAGRVQEAGKKRKKSTSEKKDTKRRKTEGRKLSPTGVLSRPTARAKQFRSNLNWEATNLVFPRVRGTKGRDIRKSDLHVPRVTLLQLDEGLRKKIWRLAASQPDQWIDIGSEIGREQPDLAMVSRQVRGEVLPIYYGENTFGIVLGAGSRSRGTAAAAFGGPSGIMALKEWTSALSKKKNEGGKWFSMIKRWCFVYKGSGPVHESNEFDAEDSVVSMVLTNAGDPHFQIHRREECISTEPCDWKLSDLDLLSRIMNTIGSDGRISNAKTLSKLAGGLLGMKAELAPMKCQAGFFPGPDFPTTSPRPPNLGPWRPTPAPELQLHETTYKFDDPDEASNENWTINGDLLLGSDMDLEAPGVSNGDWTLEGV
ncbi:Hypothetical predicted protein [Lecanosticta acicola]|uniref:Uncharacterized protein n=1 Tax=Lecanosticta acicola TaxID=111012 RepID=A0AAI8YPH9_9PEZI|nr:Hypothetical predicted protein [Lecanosticta acicola]